MFTWCLTRFGIMYIYTAVNNSHVILTNLLQSVSIFQHTYWFRSLIFPVTSNMLFFKLMLRYCEWNSTLPVQMFHIKKGNMHCYLIWPSIQGHAHKVATPWNIPCFIIYSILNGTIIYKINMMLYWRRLETRDWDHKLFGKMFTEATSQLQYYFRDKVMCFMFVVTILMTSPSLFVNVLSKQLW